jgi:hypothetical protein
MTPRIIWTAWFQGWDAAPELVRSCIRSWEDRNPGWELRVLSNSNLRTWLTPEVDLPPAAGGWMTAQAYSDLVRITLLARYGGVWVDATTWCAQPLDDWLPELSQSGFFAFAQPGPDRMLSSWFLAASQDSLIVQRWDAACHAYWHGRDVEDAYFWFHYQFAVSYETDPGFAAMWDAVPKRSAQPPHELQYVLLEPVSEYHARALAGATAPVHKLAHAIGPRVPGSVLDAVCTYWEDERPARVLVLWFGSIPGHGTIGDLLSVRAVCAALLNSGFEVDCVSWQELDGVESHLDLPAVLDHDVVVFVCGPVMRTHTELNALFEHVAGRALVGVGVSLLPAEHANFANPFDVVLAREGGQPSYADVALAAAVSEHVPPVRGGGMRIGLSLRGLQTEYGPETCLSDLVDELVDELLSTHPEWEVLPIEHRLADMSLTAAETEALYASCDLVLTTRLHGALLALRNGTPFIAIDQIVGGAKIASVLAGSGWPFVFRADLLTFEQLAGAVDSLLAGAEGLPPIAALHERSRVAAETTLDQLTTVVHALSGGVAVRNAQVR